MTKEIPTCEIRWIDDRGNSTPDTNISVAKVRCLFRELARISGKPHEPSGEYHICANHLDRMLNFPNDDWEVTEIIVRPATIQAIRKIEV